MRNEKSKAERAVGRVAAAEDAVTRIFYAHCIPKGPVFARRVNNTVQLMASEEIADQISDAIDRQESL